MTANISGKLMNMISTLGDEMIISQLSPKIRLYWLQAVGIPYGCDT
jgi:hypothetical protein